MRIPIFDQISWGLKPDTGKNTGSGMIRNPLYIDSTFYEILRQSKKCFLKLGKRLLSNVKVTPLLELVKYVSFGEVAKPSQPT